MKLPFKDPEKYKKYMREYQRRQRSETTRLIKRSQNLIALFIVDSERRRKQRDELLSFFHETVLILNQPQLSDSEIVRLLKAITISEEMEKLKPKFKAILTQ